MQEFIRANGAVVYWSPSEYSDLQRIADGLDRIGLKKFAPDKRTIHACLADALGEQFKGRDWLIEPLKGKQAFEVVRVARGEAENGYSRHGTYKINDQKMLSAEPFRSEEADKIAAEFNRHSGMIRAASVTQCLVSIVEHLAGTRLRPSVHWLPEFSLETWAQACETISGTGVGKANDCYTLRVAHDEDSVRAVRDGFVQEITSSVKLIEEAIQGGELGARALASRQKEAVAMRERIKLFEGLLEQGLADLLVQVDAIELAAGQAAIQLAAQDEAA